VQRRAAQRIRLANRGARVVASRAMHSSFTGSSQDTHRAFTGHMRAKQREREGHTSSKFDTGTRKSTESGGD